MKLVGFFVVGNAGKFGARVYGETFEPVGGNLAYWENRGYDLVEVFVKDEAYDENLDPKVTGFE